MSKAWGLALILVTCSTYPGEAADGPQEEDLRYWLDWRVHLAPFPSTVGYKDAEILKRRDLLGLGTGFELTYRPLSGSDLGLRLGFDGAGVVHFLKEVVTQQPGYEPPTTVFDIATYCFSGDLALCYPISMPNDVHLRTAIGVGITDVNTPQSQMRSDGPYWTGQRNYVLGDLTLGLEADLGRRWMVEYRFGHRRQVPHTLNLYYRLKLMPYGYGQVWSGFSVDGHANYFYLGYSKRKMSLW